MDLIFLKKLQSYAKFLGLCPWHCDTTKTSFNYSYLVVLIEILLMITNLYLWHEAILAGHFSIQLFFPSGELITLTAFLIASYYAAIRFGSYWTMLLENCKEIDCTLTQKGLRVNTITTHIIEIFLFNIYVVIVFVMGFFEKRNIINKVSLLYTLMYIFHTYQKLVMTVITNSLTLVIENRYKLLARLLKTEFQSNRENVSETLKEIEKFMESLMRCTDYVNVITGGTSFILLLHGFFATLGSFNGLRYFWEHPAMSNFTSTACLAYVCQRMFICFLSFTIIKGCDRVELAHYEILNVCNEFQSQLNHFTLRNDLIKFYEYAKVLSPKFTASGFFRIERNLYLSFLSVFMTYFIFVGQLYTS